MHGASILRNIWFKYQEYLLKWTLFKFLCRTDNLVTRFISLEQSGKLSGHLCTFPVSSLQKKINKSWLNVLSAQQRFLNFRPSNAKRQQILVNNKCSFIVVLRLRATLRDSYSFMLSCHFVWNFLCPSSSFVLSYLHVRVDLKFNIFHGILSASIFWNALDHYLTFII